MARPETITKKFADKAADQLVDWFAEGQSIAEIACNLGISKESYYKCKKISEKFSDAEKVGLAASEAWWAKIGRAGAVGKVAINPPTWIFNMKNRFDWSDKREIDHTSSDGSMTPQKIEIVAVKPEK